MNLIWRLVLTIAISFVITSVLSKIMIPWLRKKKAGQFVRDDGPETHLKKEGTPTMGGVMMVIGIVTATLMFSSYAETTARFTVLYIVASLLLFTAIGFWDDVVMLFQKRSLGLKAWQKIVLQLTASLVIALLSYFALNNQVEAVPFGENNLYLGLLQIPFTMFVFIAMVNSVNLTDGLDGLATSLTITNAGAFLIIILLMIGGVITSTFSDNVFIANVAVFICALLGACLAFLLFNKHPAKVFMGDTGSFALGSALTAIASSLQLQLLLPIMGFMFVLSAVSVMIQVGSFKLRGKRVFKMAPLHHHFELTGVKETHVVRNYLLITIALSVLSIVSVSI